jgi:hypothetical protein
MQDQESVFDGVFMAAGLICGLVMLACTVMGAGYMIERACVDAKIDGMNETRDKMVDDYKRAKE